MAFFWEKINSSTLNFPERCAIFYEHTNYHGWSLDVSETDSERNIYLNLMSSIRVRNGCTFRAYRSVDIEDLLFSATDDVKNLGNFDGQISSYSCHCETSNLKYVNYLLLN